MTRTPNPSRRTILAAGALGLGSALASPARAETLLADLRGSLDITTYGVRPGAIDDQSAAFQRAIHQAAADGNPLFLPAGDYLVSNIDLPSGLTLVGVPGRSRIRYAGDGHLLFANEVRDLRLEGVVIDGDNRRMAGYAPALVHISTGSNIAFEDCQFLGSTKDGVVFDRVEGRIERCRISGALGAAFVSNDARGLAIRDNVVTDCADNGILVHRWSEGHDGTQVTDNRVEHIKATSGGTGPFGNGISLFRADDCIVSGNMVHDCASSAVRCNAASNVIVSDNHCARLGAVALFVEFGLEGAIVANNLVDGATRGISLTNFNDGGHTAVVQGNVIRNLTARPRLATEDPVQGIGISVEADTSVTGNVIEQGAYAGIMAGWGPYLRNVIVSQNVVRDVPFGVAVSVVDGVGQSVISDNIFTDTPRGAVVGMRWLEQATDDLTQGASAPAPLTVVRNRTMS